MSEIGRCPNYEDIAKKIGVNRRTLYRWRLRKDFERELRKAIDIKMTAKYGGRHANILDAARNGDIAYLERLFDALALR
jgi:transposase-like protein